MSITVSMTMKQAEILGIVKCAHCGCPPNNHFLGTHPERCAHCHTDACEGYKPRIVLPTEKPR